MCVGKWLRCIGRGNMVRHGNCGIQQDVTTAAGAENGCMMRERVCWVGGMDEMFLLTMTQQFASGTVRKWHENVRCMGATAGARERTEEERDRRGERNRARGGTAQQGDSACIMSHIVRGTRPSLSSLSRDDKAAAAAHPQRADLTRARHTRRRMHVKKINVYGAGGCRVSGQAGQPAQAQRSDGPGTQRL